jgi:hypothetical protein
MKITKSQLKQIIKEELAAANEEETLKKKRWVDAYDAGASYEEAMLLHNSPTIDKIVNILNDEFGPHGALIVIDEIKETFLALVRSQKTGNIQTIGGLKAADQGK